MGASTWTRTVSSVFLLKTRTTLPLESQSVLILKKGASAKKRSNALSKKQRSSKLKMKRTVLASTPRTNLRTLSTKANSKLEKKFQLSTITATRSFFGWKTIQRPPLKNFKQRSKRCKRRFKKWLEVPNREHLSKEHLKRTQTCQTLMKL